LKANDKAVRMNMKKLLLLFLLIPHVCFGATYYIREDGTATNKEATTSCIAPVTAMSAAIHNKQKFSAGDTICICAEGGVLSANSLELSSSGATNSYITYNGDCNSAGTKAELQKALSGINIDYTKFINLRFTTASKGLVLLDGSSNNWVSYCDFYGLAEQGIFASGLTKETYTQDWIIENSTFTNIGIYSNSASADINIGGFCRRWTFRYNTHIGNGTAGIDGINISNINVAGGDGSGHIIENSSFTSYYENGIDLKGTKESSAGEGDTIIRKCTFTGGSGSEGQLHIQFNARGVVVDECIFSDTDNNAISLVGHSTGNDAVGYVTVQNSVFDNIRNTIFTDRGLLNSEALGHNVLNYNIMQNSGQNTPGYSLDIGSDNCIIMNNIFYHISQNSSSDMPIRVETTDNFNTLKLDYNQYGKLEIAHYYIVNNNGTLYTFSQTQEDAKEINGKLIDATAAEFFSAPSNFKLIMPDNPAE
jgi:hypothetical protein